MKTDKGTPSRFRIRHFRELGIFISLVVICTVTGIINPIFFSFDNIVDLMRSTSFTLIVAVGMTYVFLSAGLDLSVGSIIGLSGIVTGWALVAEWPVFLAILLGLGVGTLVGILNGGIIVKFRIPPLIVTLGTMYIARGFVYVISQGRPFYPFPDSFKILGQGVILRIPIAVYLAVIVSFIGHWVLRNTVFGRSVFALGGNEEASRTAGIPTERVKIGIYAISAFAASITGILMASRLSSSQAGAGTGWEMIVIASVIIGGTSLFGGSGSILGTAIGAAIMTVLTNAMVLMRVSVFWQKIVVGVIIIVAVGVDTHRRNRLSGSRG